MFCVVFEPRFTPFWQHIYATIDQPFEAREIIAQAYLILCTVDSVARQLVQAIKQFNGKFSYTFCLHESEPSSASNCTLWFSLWTVLNHQPFRL